MENSSNVGIPQNKIDKEGALQIYNNKKKKWSNRWAILCGSALYYQKKKGDDTKVVGPLLLKDGTITTTTEHPNSKKKKFAFKIQAPQEDGTNGPFFFSVPDEDTRKEWIAVLNSNKTKDSVDIILRIKQSASMRVKKNVSCAVATSTAGKDVIRKFVGKKALQSIEIVKEVVARFEDKKKASEIENAIIKVAVKAILLWQNKDITEDDIVDVVPLVQTLWVDVLNYCQMPFTYDPVNIKTHGEELVVVFSTVLAPYVSEKTLHLLKDTITYLNQKELMDIVFEQESQDVMRKELVRILNTEWAKQRFKVQI